MGAFSAKLSNLAGGNRWRLARWQKQLPVIAAFEPELQRHRDNELARRASRCVPGSQPGTALDLMPESSPWCARPRSRKLNMRHFDVQMLGGMALFERSIAEMQTGEGKTLTATLGMYLYALAGKGCHLATVTIIWPAATRNGCVRCMKCSVCP